MSFLKLLVAALEPEVKNVSLQMLLIFFLNLKNCFSNHWLDLIQILNLVFRDLKLSLVGPIMATKLCIFPQYHIPDG
jgi:hypothetical protein